MDDEQLNAEDQVIDDPQVETPEVDSQDQSEASTVQEKLYTTPDGRQLTADQMFNEYNNLVPEFTKRSQKLKEYEAKLNQNDQSKSEPKEEEDFEAEIERRRLKKELSQVGIADREYVDKGLEEIRQMLTQREAEEKAMQLENFQRVSFKTANDSLSKKYDGLDGKPKYDPQDIAKFLDEEGISMPNDPSKFEKVLEYGYKLRHENALRTAKKGPVKPTMPKGGDPVKGSMEEKPVSTWEEARRSAAARLGA